MIASLISKKSEDEVKFIMIDPEMVGTLCHIMGYFTFINSSNNRSKYGSSSFKMGCKWNGRKI